MQTAIETTGTVSANRSIILDEGLPLKESSRVRVIVFLDEPREGDIDETEWMQFLAKNEALDFLADEREDIYTLEDGEPI